MSKAIAQSTDVIAKSVLPENEFPFAEVLAKLAKTNSTVSSVKRKLNLNKQSLRDSLKNEFVGAYVSVYDNGFVPSNVWDKICFEVDNFIANSINTINAGNVISTVSRFRFDTKMGVVKLRHTNIGEDNLSLSEQRFGLVCLITDAEKSLHRLQVNPLPDLSKITTATGKLESLKVAKLEIEAEIIRQQQLAIS